MYTTYCGVLSFDVVMYKIWSQNPLMPFESGWFSLFIDLVVYWYMLCFVHVLVYCEVVFEKCYVSMRLDLSGWKYRVKVRVFQMQLQVKVWTQDLLYCFCYHTRSTTTSWNYPLTPEMSLTPGLDIFTELYEMNPYVVSYYQPCTRCWLKRSNKRDGEEATSFIITFPIVQLHYHENTFKM